MNCPACAHSNRPGAKFCEECAAPLPRACAGCGAELRASAKFCDECGAPTGAAAPSRPAASSDARKVVTIVFADLVGSTALHERLDPESARRFMEGYYAAMRGAVESHGGTVTQFLGDGAKAVFGIPRVAEDDAIRAVRAAVAMQAAFRALADAQRSAVGKTGLRVAVNTGEVVTNDASEIIGDPVNVAARLQEQGRDGDVVIGETTERLVSALVTLELLGSFALKGRTEAVSAYRVTSLERPVGVAAAAFVGRDRELARILSVYDAATEKPATALAVLLGSPGLGKSRLIEEFARRLGEGATLIHARCDAAGGATFAPLADALRALPGLDALLPGGDAERTRVLDGVRALLAGSPAPPEETFFVVRRLLAALASAKPVVLVIDDVHWAEPLLLDLIEHLVQWGVGVPLLVLVGARPELREIRSTLVTPGGLVSDVVTLSGLDAGAAMRLAANVIGAADLPASVAAKVLATSEGNPLFVGELVRMLVHEGALKREGERWTAGTALAALEMPPTIHALLAARIERLRPEERIVLERAAVIGRSFSRSAVAELLSRDAADLDARLESLRRAELIERDSGWFLGEPLLRFHHVLIRDAAYRRILKGTRAELHARFADWIEARTGDSLEHDETIGWHLEQAHQHLRELGPIDARGRVLGERAAQRLAAAGRRALARDDVPLASGLLGRALDRLDRDDAARAELALDWCEALLAAGDVAPATAALEELDRFAASDARLRAWHTCFAGQLVVLTAPSGLVEAAESVAAASRELAELGDVAGEAKAHFVHAQAFARLGKVAACEAALDRALAAARRAGDRRRANTVLAIAPLAALWGPSPVTRASGRCLDVVRVLRITQGAPAVEAVALSCQGVLEALRGRTDAARRMIASARKMVEELGITPRLLEADVFAARIDLLDGDAAAAERGLRAAYEGMRELGLGIDAARAAALLARALLALDRVSEAEELSRESEQLAGDDLQAAIAWRGARAEALARRGQTVEAVELATKAVEVAAATDALLDHADARLALAAALRAAGRDAEADTEEGHATELWIAKGATLLAERARRANPQPATAAARSEARREPSRPARLRVRANRASAAGPRFEAAAAVRDLAALEQLFSDPCVVVHHPTGATYGRREQLKTWRSLFRAEQLTYRREALATLGDSLELARHRIAASGFVEARLASAGDIEIDEFVISEDDGHGRHGRFEIFADDQLGQAIARLYERHAELLPDGAERVRAQAISRAAGVMLGQPDLAATATVLAPDVEFSDLRTVGFGTLRGAEAVLQTIAAMMDLSRDDSARIDDLLVLESDALVVRWTNRGTHVESGGAFERKLCQLFAFDAAGRLSRWQQFEAEHDGAALARFDALARSTGPKGRSRRRVRPSLAGETLARMDAACAARDVDAVRALHREDFEEVHHPTGSTYGLDGAYASLDSLLRLPNPRMVHELLATLGERHVLARRTTGASSGGRGRIDAGAWEREELVVAEVDEQGRFRGYDTFGSERLADAVVRLYKRRADSPGGTARGRAVATAESLAALLAPPDIDRIAASVASSVETNDHKVLGYGRARGAENVLRAIRIQIETAEAIAPRVDDVLALEPSALLVRRTVSGVLRDGGGPYEILMISLYACGDDGLVEHWEQFDPDRDAEALARFDALVAGDEPKRRVRANAASRNLDRLLAARRAGDLEAHRAAHAAQVEVIHHPTGATYGLKEVLGLFSALSRTRNLRFVHESLATLGDSLALVRRYYAHDGSESRFGSVGAAEGDYVVLMEVDEQGLMKRSEVFSGDRLGDAVARLYERHAELSPRGPARDRAATTARAVTAMVTSSVEQGFEESITPTFEAVDHRLVGHETVGTQEMQRGFAAWRELTDAVQIRVDEVLALSPEALLRRSTSTGVIRATGGAFERTILMLSHFGGDGRIERTELFDVEQEAEALARLDALVDGDEVDSESPFANAAWRKFQAYSRAWIARDWQTIESQFSTALRMDDQRRMVRLQIGADDFLAQLRLLFDLPGGRWDQRLIATRGERLALSRGLFHAEVEGGGGPLEFAESLSVYELGVDGRIVALVVFDPADEDAAYAELDARFDSGEGAEHARVLATVRARERAHERRDWDAWGATVSPGFRYRDHRLLGWGTGDVPAGALIPRSLVELAPDVRVRRDHIRLCERGALQQITNLGTRDGGAFEMMFVSVVEIDAQGRVLWNDTYDVDRAALAQERFEELRTTTPAPFANSATRFLQDRFQPHGHARDWTAFAQLLAAGFRFEDRRRLVQVALDRDGYVGWSRVLGDMTNATVADVLATRGERLVLQRVRNEVAGGVVGASDLEHLNLMEIDPYGQLLMHVRFELDDLDAAYAELDARFEAGEDQLHAVHATIMSPFARAIETRDWTPLLALCAPTVVEYDNRGFAVLGTTHGAEAWLANFRVLGELAPDSRYRVDHFRSCARGLCTAGVWHGTREGGPYEIPLVAVLELDEQKRIARGDIYDADQVDRARARFEELVGVGAAEPASERFANAASLTDATLLRCFNTRDWPGILACVAPELVFDERRRMTRNTCDRDVWLEQFRFMFEVPAGRFTTRLLATRGARLSLNLHCFAGEVAGGGGPLAMEDHFALHEVDRDGRIVAIVLFDQHDLDAAHAELDARFDAGEAAAHSLTLGALRDTARAMSARDWDAYHSSFAPDLVCHDHRVLGWGTLYGADTFVRMGQSLVELAPDARWRNDHIRVGPRGHFQASLQFGTRDGGAFELELLRVFELDAQGRIRRIDVYDTGRPDEALARFAELGAPLVRRRRFESTATRVFDEMMSCLRARDWDRFSRLLPSEFRYSDRQPMVQLDLDRERYLAFVRPLHTMSTTAGDADVLATRGDRLLLGRRRVTLSDSEFGLSELEHVNVFEVDARGRMIAVVRFEASALDAAHAELDARFDAGEAAAHPVAAAWLRGYLRCFAARDWAGLRALFAPDLVGHNHRLVGWGTLHGPEALVSTLEAQVGLAPDTRERVDHVRTCERGVLFEYAWLGSHEGGAFENVWLVAVELDARGRASRADVWEQEQLAPALARFEEIRAKASLVSIAMERWRTTFDVAFATDDWGPMRALCTPQFCFDDRRRLAQVSGGLELMIASARERVAIGARPEMVSIETAGDRVAIMRTLWSGGPEDGRFEIEYLAVVEIDASGLISTFVFLDADDTRAAQREAWARWAAIDPAAAETDAALARFEALSPDPPRLPPNAATRLSDRAARAIAAGDRAALRACASSEFRFEDRGKRALVSGDVEVWLDSALFLASERRAQLEPELLATIGDRIAVYRDSWSGDTEGGGFELGGIRVFESDDQGGLHALLLFDIEDRAAAFSDAIGRFVSGEAAGCVAARVLAEFLRAVNERDWDALRATYTSDFSLADLRPLGLGTLDLDTWIASLQASVALSVVLAFEVSRVLAWNDRGVVTVLRRHGSIPDGGGSFENFPIGMALVRGDRIARYELFEETDVERALARFAELCSPGAR